MDNVSATINSNPPVINQNKIPVSSVLTVYMTGLSSNISSLQYLWQMYDDNSLRWINLTDASDNNFTNSNYTVRNIDSGLDIRCLVKYLTTSGLKNITSSQTVSVDGKIQYSPSKLLVANNTIKAINELTGFDYRAVRFYLESSLEIDRYGVLTDVDHLDMSFNNLSLVNYRGEGLTSVDDETILDGIFDRKLIVFDNSGSSLEFTVSNIDISQNSYCFDFWTDRSASEIAISTIDSDSNHTPITTNFIDLSGGDGWSHFALQYNYFTGQKESWSNTVKNNTQWSGGISNNGDSPPNIRWKLSTNINSTARFHQIRWTDELCYI